MKTTEKDNNNKNKIIKVTIIITVTKKPRKL